jgi:hypothetical protein
MNLERIDPEGPASPPLPGEGSAKTIDPERSLWAAVIAMARDDIEKYADSDTADGKRLYADAADWVNSRSRAWMSFEWVCDLVGTDPDHVRRLINRHTRQRSAAAA